VRFARLRYCDDLKALMVSIGAERYNPRMDTQTLVAAIDEEIDRLQKVRSLLTGHAAPLKRGRPPGRKLANIPRRRNMSAEGRANIIAAQRARWAKTRKKRQAKSME
jgi:hypothetical protein